MRYANESSVVSSLGESASHAPARAPTKITGRETVYIVIVNWNGWRDTIECLESVLRNRYESYRVIVCDNGSSNDSVDRIREWAEGRLDLPSDSTHPLASLTRPGVPKPVPYTFLSRAEAEQGPLPNEVPPLVLIDCAANLGFAGGSNVGLRFALRQPDCGYAWLLNNDTVIDPNALVALVERMHARPTAGQIGSRLLFYDEPNVVQALGGGRYNKWLGLSRAVGGGQSADASVSVGRAERETFYVVGASLFVSREFLERVGLMNESYFLYFEETDWAMRSRGKFDVAYAHDSVVYHKEGRSMGSSSVGERRSVLADFFLVRNRLRFTRLYVPLALPTVLVTLLLVLGNRVRRRQFDRVLMMLRIMLSPSTYSVRDTVSPRDVLARYSARPAGA